MNAPQKGGSQFYKRGSLDMKPTLPVTKRVSMDIPLQQKNKDL